MAAAKKKSSRSRKSSKKSTKKSKRKATKKKASKKKSTRKKSKKKATRKKAKKKTTKKATKKKAAKRKATKKKAAKKSTKRRATKKKPAGRAEKVRSTSRERVYNLTKEVPDHEFFVLANGKPVKHVAELAAILDQLEDEIFNHHIRPDSHDYHNWIKHVFEDLELARKIAGVDDKKKMQLVIYKHLAGHD